MGVRELDNEKWKQQACSMTDWTTKQDISAPQQTQTQLVELPLRCKSIRALYNQDKCENANIQVQTSASQNRTILIS